jgi:hypothetical protein
MALTFKRYTYAAGSAAGLPITWDNNVGEHDWDEVCTAAGFDPSDDETGTGTLDTPWEGHPAGALVISGLMQEGDPFAISNESS